MPDQYKTNSTEIGGWVTQGITHLPPELLAQSVDHAKGLLSWLPGQLKRHGDILGATLGVEQMSHDHWWMGLEAGGKYFHLNFGVESGRLWVRLSDQSEESAEWEGDNRERPNARIGYG